MNRKEISVTERIFACMLIIIAETGMRVEELCLLETGKLSSITVNEKTIYYLNFITTKGSSSEVEKIDTYCYLTDIAAKAYKTAESIVYDLIDNMSEKVRFNVYLDIIKKEKISIDTSLLRPGNLMDLLKKNEIDMLDKHARRYLYLLEHTSKKILHITSLRDYMVRFTIRNCDILLNTAEKYREEISYFKVESKSRFEKFFGRGVDNNLCFEDISRLEYPYVNFHRFRVTVCTKLYEKGVPLDFIRTHLNHLYDEMTAYYIKSDKKVSEFEENIEVLQTLVDDKGYIKENLENEQLQIVNVEEKIKKINNFLKRNKINIKSDLGKVLDVIKKANGTVVENEFGVCIKTLISGACKRRQYFSSDKDNYHIGLELNTFKYIDLNYERFKQKIKIIEHNRRKSRIKI
ncbi:MAG: tyrosine-type recombinase/integrase [Sarcina sp.]